MCTVAGLHESQNRREPSLTRPLDEAMWQAWVAKGRSQERRSTAARVKAMKWMLIAGLVAATGLWLHLTFGVPALLHNPVGSVFSFAGHWHPALAVTSAFPFVASLAWPNERLAQ